jgi:CRP-like cAMP-binding protein
MVSDEPVEKSRHDGLSAVEHATLLGSSIVRNIAPGLQKRLLVQGRACVLKKNDLLFMEGEPVNAVYCLLSGKLKEYYAGGCGDSCLRCIQIPGSYVSLHLVFNQVHTHSYYCEALERCTCFAWNAESFLDLARHESSLGFQVAAGIAGYFENSCRLSCICRKPQALCRVAGYLLHRRTGHSADVRPLGVSASSICLARETFSRSLAVLQEKNLIRIQDGMVELLDVDGLKQISGTV